jgi:flagellar FliJ protein
MPLDRSGGPPGLPKHLVDVPNDGLARPSPSLRSLLRLEARFVNRLFRLGPVLRARKAQEDAARGAVVQSRAELRDAAALVKRRQLDLAGADAPTEGTARAMVASMVARQSLAATLSAAHRMVADVEEHTEERVADLAEAAKRRRAVEMMAEKHAEMVRVHDLKVDQDAIDELAVTSKQRAAARGVDGVNERRANTLRHGSPADRDAAERAAAARAVANRATIDLAAANRSIVERITADRAEAATTEAAQSAESLQSTESLEPSQSAKPSQSAEPSQSPA